jgi:hypothetical protein
LVSIPTLNFSHRFQGVIWNMVAGTEHDPLIIEVRDTEKKQVTFSALDLSSGEFRWRDRTLEENWWISLTLVHHGILIFTAYLDTNNPDKKGILAYSASDLSQLWWVNDFSVSSVTASTLRGFSQKFGLKEHAVDMKTGREVLTPPDDAIVEPHELLKPAQYLEGTEYFATVKTFLLKQLNLNVVSALEYLEFEKSMIISCYVAGNDSPDMANFLIVFSRTGECLLKEEISSRAKGIGLDTFFVLRNNLIFVKNKNELLSYRIL